MHRLEQSALRLGHGAWVLAMGSARLASMSHDVACDNFAKKLQCYSLFLRCFCFVYLFIPLQNHHDHRRSPRTGRVLLALQDGDVLVYATTRGKSKAGVLVSSMQKGPDTFEYHLKPSRLIKCLKSLTRYIRSTVASFLGGYAWRAMPRVHPTV